jgi:hypothetical protein
MDRTVSSVAGPDPRLLPMAPTAYAVVTDPGAVDTPDVPSYQPYVYGHLNPPALIPLQMKEVDLAVDCALDTAHVTLRARWWMHCVTRSRACDVRLVVPMGEQVSTIRVPLPLLCRGLAFRLLLLTRIVRLSLVGIQIIAVAVYLEQFNMTRPS